MEWDGSGVDWRRVVDTVGDVADEGVEVRKLVVLCMLSILVAGCANDKPSTTSREVAKGSVDLLFTHDGVRVYRFGDGGRYHYYAVPYGGGASTFSTWSENCGKNCTTTLTDEIQTLVAR